MAPYIKFLISFIFGAAGLWAYLTWPTWMGVMAFIGLFFAGSCLASYIFKRTATKHQIKQDLEARLHND